MTAKKIAYISSSFPVLTETFIIREVEELRRKGVDVEVFSLKSPQLKGTLQSNTKFLIETTHYYPYILSFRVLNALIYYFVKKPATSCEILAKIITTHISSPLLLLKTIAIIPKSFAIAKTLKEMGMTKVHAHWATIPTTVAWIISELNGCDFTFTAHAWDIFKTDTMLEEKITKAKKVITCTGFNKKYLLEKYPRINPEKIIVVYHGLDLKRFIPHKRIRGDQFTILSIGRLTEKKGIHYLLKACSILRETGIPFHAYIIYVRGNFEKEIFRLYDSLGLKSCIELIPEMSQEKLMDYYENADCFVLPCLIAKSGERDGIPNVILEALAMELPVVSTDVSGIPEVVNDGKSGLLVEPENAEEIAYAIEKLYFDNELRCRLGNNGRQLIKQEFEISANVDRLIKNIL